MEKRGFNFEDLDIRKDWMRMCVSVYKLMRNCTDSGFKDQIQRASVSISSNIAEGFERQTNKEFIQFLYIAKGSCGELRTQIYLAKELEYVSREEYKIMLEQSKLLPAKIQNYIKTRKALQK
ncbi:MAG: four helix bundle protein [Prevotellaceae bacterium]|jgi:four helix bundle protein|nr:four helix bundle protein [Prevotellaceae bacterium]